MELGDNNSFNERLESFFSGEIVCPYFTLDPILKKMDNELNSKTCQEISEILGTIFKFTETIVLQEFERQYPGLPLPLHFHKTTKEV